MKGYLLYVAYWGLYPLAFLSAIVLYVYDKTEAAYLRVK